MTRRTLSLMRNRKTDDDLYEMACANCRTVYYIPLPTFNTLTPCCDREFVSLDEFLEDMVGVVQFDGGMPNNLSLDEEPTRVSSAEKLAIMIRLCVIGVLILFVLGLAGSILFR